MKITFPNHKYYYFIIGAPRIVISTSLLPFSLVAKTCPPSKDGDAKITIDINKKSVLLAELFSGKTIHMYMFI